MNERQTLLHKVQMYDFALVDAALFLDGHPKDAAALAYYQQTLAMYDQAVADYEAQFGPLTKKQAKDTAQWRWVDDPWPWEGEDIKIP